MTSRSTNYSFVSRYLKHVSSSSVLILFTLLALICANLPLVQDWYFSFWQKTVSLSIGCFNFFSHNGHSMTLGNVINDFLMAIFFLSVGLEIKREFKVGELSTREKATMPIIGACGGMIVPVLLFWIFCPDDELMRRGLAIPMATDIAFSLGVLALFGKRVPLGLKVFLAALAVADDLGGIIVIALFYSSHIEITYIILSLLCVALMILGNYLGNHSKYYYVSIGIILWYFMLNSGIHSTIAGVIVAFCVPATLKRGTRKYLERIRKHINRFPVVEVDETNNTVVWTNEEIHALKSIESAADKMISPLQDLEDNLHFLIHYIVIPLFAFSNAGICFANMSFASVISGVSVAVMIGLVAGKFIGVFSFSWLAVRAKIVKLPTNTNWKSFAGVCMLCGIGFTVSMFIAGLSYHGSDPASAMVLDQAKLGVLVGSVISAVCGSLILRKHLPAE